MADIKVEYDSHVGDCLKVCRMAKDSFGRTTDWEYAPIIEGELYDSEKWPEIGYIEGGPHLRRLSDKDQRLLKMLSRGMGENEYQDLLEKIRVTNDPDVVEELIWRFRHTTPHLAPFGHNFITFKFQAPVFVMRQIVKHEYIRISELSMRYVRGMPEYFRPKSWRSVAEDVKQGSGGALCDKLQDEFNEALYALHDADMAAYYSDLQDSLCPEQARMFLRLCHMTQGHISGSMDAIAGLVIKRLDAHAQEETREFARQIERKCREIWPWSWPALLEGVRHT